MTEPVKGFKDFTGEEAKLREEIRKILVRNFEIYGFEPAESPIIEQEEFVRGENTNDEAVSDIFKLEDKGKRKLALRYEQTFQLKRIAQNKKLPYKRFSIGPVFRDEPVTGNRFRQFTQCDIDTISSSFKEEAEILVMTSKILKELGINAIINFNNRKLMNEILDEQKIVNKEEVIREIDKLDKLPKEEVKANLKKYKAEKLVEIFEQKESFFKKYKAYKEIQELKEFCKLYGIEINFQPTLARGLAYYNGSVYEVKNSTGILDAQKSKQESKISDIKTKELKETICAGGSYLINGMQSTGISFGLERLSMLTKLKQENKEVLIISLEQDKKAIELAEELRKQGTRVIIMYGKPSKALEYANSYSIPKVIFIGEDEVKKKKLKIKDMKSGKEEFLAEKEIIKKFD